MTETTQSSMPLDRDELLAGYRIVQRTIIRPDQELDIRPLYVGGVSSMSGEIGGARQSGAPDDERAALEPGAPEAQSSDGDSLAQQRTRRRGWRDGQGRAPDDVRHLLQRLSR